jgi:hypothetical protein
MKRNEFLKRLGIGVGAAMVAPSVIPSLIPSVDPPVVPQRGDITQYSSFYSPLDPKIWTELTRRYGYGVGLAELFYNLNG